jgi:hypothetical protein
VEHRNLSSGCKRKSSKQHHCKSESTEARHRGGLTGSSDDPVVMMGERSGQLIQLIELIN